MKSIRNKTGAVPVLAIIVIAALVAAALVIAGILTDGFGLGGGQGGGEGAENAPETTAAESEPETVPVIEELEFLNVTVSENEYLYQNSKLTLDELIERLRTDAADTRVKVTDENASKKAYDSLINALRENKINYIEAY